MTRALILGATSDIAIALAHQFASRGFDLTLAARNVERLESVVPDLEIRHNVKVEAVEFDALDFATHASFYDNLAEKPNAAICVFGYLGDQAKAQRDFCEAERIIETNYTGAVSILTIIANDFEQRKSGTIIGISSVAGDRGRQSNYLYGSAKAALTTYLSGLRNRLARSNVHVVTVKPGFVRTKMTSGLALPGPLTAKPERVAADIFEAYQKRGDQLYTLWLWRYLMFIIRNIPEPVFKRLRL